MAPRAREADFVVPRNDNSVPSSIYLLCISSEEMDTL